MLPDQYEIESADHFEATDHIVPRADFKWPANSGSVVSLLSTKPPSNEQHFKRTSPKDLPMIIGELSKAQPHSSVSMRLELSFLDDGKLDVRYTGFSYQPIAILSNVGESLAAAIEYYRGRNDNIVIYATPTGHYWICTYGANLI